jgi:hypothetical protein
MMTSVEQLGVQSALYTPYSFIDFTVVNAAHFSVCISKPFLVAKSTILVRKEAHCINTGSAAVGLTNKLT